MRGCRRTSGPSISIHATTTCFLDSGRTTRYPRAIYILSSNRATVGMPEIQEAHRTGWHGLHDPVLRLADMDREGVAAELVYHGDFRLGDLFHNATNRQYPLEVWDAGARAWNRWAADTFGFATDRFLLTGAIGPCADMGSTVADLEWIADQGFAARRSARASCATRGRPPSSTSTGNRSGRCARTGGSPSWCTPGSASTRGWCPPTRAHLERRIDGGGRKFRPRGTGQAQRRCQRSPPSSSPTSPTARSSAVPCGS